MNTGPRLRTLREPWVLQKKAFTPIGLLLESPLLGYLIGHVYRTFDIFCEQRQSGTPLEKMRGARRGQKPSSHPFGMIGFVKPVLLKFGWLPMAAAMVGLSSSVPLWTGQDWRPILGTSVDTRILPPHLSSKENLVLLLRKRCW